MHELNYLLFDRSEDEDGNTTWDAMASATASRVPELVAEVQAVLAWADAHFKCAPLDEGGDWDLDLQAQDDAGQPLPVQWHAGERQLHVSAAGAGRSTLSVSISGTPQFAQAFDATWLG
jgi:hypothetical protein